MRLGEKDLNAVEEVESLLKNMGYTNTKRASQRSSIIRLYTKENRLSVVNKLIASLPKASVSKKKLTHVLFSDIAGRIEVKPEGRQGNDSAGIQNEVSFYNLIKKTVSERGALTIRLRGRNGKIFDCRSVRDASLVGRNTRGRQKADVILHGEKNYRISLKKENSEYWESADSLIGKKVRSLLEDLLKKGSVSLEPLTSEVMRLDKEIAYKATLGETKDVVFGSDILNNGCVVVGDFVGAPKPKFINNALLIPTEKVYRTPSEVYTDSDNSVWFLLRNDRTRRSTSLGIAGIRVLATYQKRIRNRKNVLRITNQKEKQDGRNQEDRDVS